MQTLPQIFGWLGDSIDILSIITTLFGVCTSLGLGALQVNAGLQFLNPNIPYNENVQILIIWTITLCATVSVVTGKITDQLLELNKYNCPPPIPLTTSHQYRRSFSSPKKAFLRLYVTLNTNQMLEVLYHGI